MITNTQWWLFRVFFGRCLFRISYKAARTTAMIEMFGGLWYKLKRSWITLLCILKLLYSRSEPLLLSVISVSSKQKLWWLIFIEKKGLSQLSTQPDFSEKSWKILTWGGFLLYHLSSAVRIDISFIYIHIHLFFTGKLWTQNRTNSHLAW